MSPVMSKNLVPGARIVYEASGVNCFGVIIKVITAEYGGRTCRVLNDDTGQKEDVACIQIRRVYPRERLQLRPSKTINISIRKQGVSDFDCGLVRARLREIADIVENLNKRQIFDLLKDLREKYPQ